MSGRLGLRKKKGRKPAKIMTRSNNNNNNSLNKRNRNRGTRTLKEEDGEEVEEVVEEPLGGHVLEKTSSTNNNRPQGLLKNVLHLPPPPSFLARLPLPSLFLMFLVRSI